MGPSILVVDDESSPRVVLRRFLEKAGCVVREAPSANDALDLMKSTAADIVFSDVRMPLRDGLWLAEQIRAEWPDVSIVMVSGADDYPTIRSARKIGVVDYLLKPFGRETVLQALARAVQAQEERKTAAAPGASSGS